jgi:hypothetical protein
MVKAAFAGLCLAGCGLESELVGPLGDRGLVVLPAPRDTVLHGRATPAAGGQARFFGGAGLELGGEAVPIAADGGFERSFNGALHTVGLVMWAEKGDRVVAGVLPELLPQPTVFHEPHHLYAWLEHPSLADLNAASTALAVVLAEAARRRGLGLGGLPATTVRAALDELVLDLADPATPLAGLAQRLAGLDAAAAASSTGEPALLSRALSDPGSPWWNPAWLAGAGAAIDVAALDASLASASEGLELGVCYEPARIRVVFHVALAEGLQNANCSVVDPYKWAAKDPTKRVFLTGGVHEDTPICDAARATACLTEAQVDQVNQALGSWVPNLVRLYDDQTHGDRLGGDGIWTASFELPYFGVATAPDGAGVRLAYKYTYGLEGQGWTDSEEWPGNQRLLELEDQNGDHRVTRFDIFGDEAANKDKVNTLKPSLGGCGTIAWEAERDPACAGDSRENRRDTDGDCLADTWDEPAPVEPLTLPCAD